MASYVEKPILWKDIISTKKSYYTTRNVEVVTSEESWNQFFCVRNLLLECYYMKVDIKSFSFDKTIIGYEQWDYSAVIEVSSFGAFL